MICSWAPWPCDRMMVLWFTVTVDEFGRTEDGLLTVEIERAFIPAGRCFAAAQDGAMDLYLRARRNRDSKDPPVAEGQWPGGEEAEGPGVDVPCIENRGRGIGGIAKELQRRRDAVSDARQLLPLDGRPRARLQRGNQEFNLA